MRVSLLASIRVAAFAMAVVTATALSAQNPVDAVDYERDVRPILAANCFGCHGPRQSQSGLRLDLRQNALRGGDYGVVIIPGQSGESKLIKRLVGSDAGLQMPPTGPLSRHDIDVLRRWIDSGAEMPGRAADTAASARETSPAVQQLIDAIANDDVKRVKTLIGADRTLARAADGFGSTALMHSASCGSIAMMTALVDAGADVNAKNERAATALHWAAADPEKVKLLLSKGAAVDARTVEGRTPLYVAATMPDGAATILHLLEAGADVNAATVGGATPLFPAVNSSAALTKLLLDAGADPNRATLAGVTPILFTRDEAVVELLVAHGADVRAQSKVGETALMDAATRGDLAAAKVLIDRGADVNTADHRGYTSLILAAHHDRDAVDLVRLLLAHGADIHATAEGNTALSLAAKRGETEVTGLLRAAAAARPKRSRHGADAISSDELRTAAERGLELLVKASPTFVSKGGCNSCHNQYLPAVAQAFARRRGIAAGEPLRQLPPELSETTTERYAEQSVAGGASISALAFELFAYDMTGKSADPRIRAQIRYIKSQQLPEGYWRGGGNLTNHAQQALSRPAASRPPLTFDDVTPTAYMIRALNAYAAPADAADTKVRIEKARRWLLNVIPTRAQEHAFKLLGLKWSSADRDAVDAAEQELEALQRPDGGFAQLSTLPSDAYATGLALFALYESGMSASHRAYQAGLRYLLRTQAPDGTWHVKSRSLEFQPYFESGFPYAHDQWISAAGTAYATLAIAAAVEPPNASRSAGKLER